MSCNIRGQAEKAWMAYMKPFCLTQNVQQYRALQILEAQVDPESGAMVGIEAPFIAFGVTGMEPANGESNLDDDDQNQSGKVSIKVRTLAENIYTDATKKVMLMTGGDFHDDLVGRVLDAIFQIQIPPDERQSLPDVLNALDTPGILFEAVYRPSQGMPHPIGATYESDILIPFMAYPSTTNE